MKIYYAHPMVIYNSLQEERDLDLIKRLFPDAEIFNPNNPTTQEECKGEMEYFYNIVRTCDLIVFRGLPNMKIPAGVWGEIQCGIENTIPSIELPCLTERKMSVEDTRQFMRDIGNR
jgi:hypothetical protein